MKGHFITFEGGEGAGKSTQISRLKARLEASGVEVIVTREPGGSEGAELIRDILLSGKAKSLGARGEAMLFAAARADHVDATILPALEAGKWVLCDRYSDSTRVYQGEAGVDTEMLDLLETAAIAGTRPELTILVDVSADVGLSRVASRSKEGSGEGPDRFENEQIDVHERRRHLFLDLARQQADRFAVVDGSKEAAAVEADIWAAVSTHFAAELANPTEEADGAGG